MSFVEVVRGAAVESRHEVQVAVASEDGLLVASVGRTDGLTFYRSAAKPMQALPLVVKLGAEGVNGAAIPGDGLGVAIKVLDVLNTRGERVGVIRPAFTLEPVGCDAPTARATHTISEQ